MNRFIAVVAASAVAALPSVALADQVHLPFTHDSKPLDHASVVGQWRDIHTVITPTATGFHVFARFSQGNRFQGTHMCSAADFRDKDGQLIAQVRQGAGINATFGGKTLVRGRDNDVTMTAEQQARVTFVEIVQKECPVKGPLDGLPLLSLLPEVIKVVAM